MPTYGYLAAKRTVEAGRAAFFGSASFDLPVNRSAIVAANDLIPQFGFVGSQFTSRRVLLLGINPGNGHDETVGAGDRMMMPALRSFATHPSLESFTNAQAAYRAVCESWPVWGRHCSTLLASAGLSVDEIAYSNCLPWRTASKSAFNDRISERAAALYALPLVEELAPKLIIAAGKKAASILAHSSSSLPPIMVWNRAQALTSSVATERAAAVANLKALLAGM